MRGGCREFLGAARRRPLEGNQFHLGRQVQDYRIGCKPIPERQPS